MSIENGIPQVELPVDYPHDIALRLQDKRFLETTKNLSSTAIFPFGIQQTILREVVSETIDSPGITTAVETGASIYTVAVGIMTNPDPYSTERAHGVALRGAFEFNRYIGLDETKLIDKFRQADARMFADAPLLAEVVDEVTGRYYHDKGMHDLARYGAAAMRGLHILVNKRLLQEEPSEES